MSDKLLPKEPASVPDPFCTCCRPKSWHLPTGECPYVRGHFEQAREDGANPLGMGQPMPTNGGDDLVPAQPSVVRCETGDCPQRAERYITCEGEGAYPYCVQCSESLLTWAHEEDRGPVDDPVVAERDRLAVENAELREVLRRAGITLSEGEFLASLGGPDRYRDAGTSDD